MVNVFDNASGRTTRYGVRTVRPNIVVAVRPNFKFAVAEDNLFQTRAVRTIINIKTTSEKLSVQEESTCSLKCSAMSFTYAAELS